MSINWSFVLNALLLTGVIVAIVRMVKAKRELNVLPGRSQPSMGNLTPEAKPDDIIAVRKVVRAEEATPVLQPCIQPALSPQPTEEIKIKTVPRVETTPEKQLEKQPEIVCEIKPSIQPKATSLVLFLLAKENRQLAGYELLQTVLAAGLRFGEGQLFHRHQHPNGQGPVLCSLATATATGVFDLQNIGAFSVHGLCLFMQPSSNKAIDAERFGIMLDTAKQLSEGLDTHLLDDQRKPWSENSLNRYYRKLGLEEEEVAY